MATTTQVIDNTTTEKKWLQRPEMTVYNRPGRRGFRFNKEARRLLRLDEMKFSFYIWNKTMYVFHDQQNGFDLLDPDKRKIILSTKFVTSVFELYNIDADVKKINFLISKHPEPHPDKGFLSHAILLCNHKKWF